MQWGLLNNLYIDIITFLYVNQYVVFDGPSLKALQLS